MALSSGVQEVLWLRSLAAEICPEKIPGPTTIYCDNKGAVDLASTAGLRVKNCKLKFEIAASAFAYRSLI